MTTIIDDMRDDLTTVLERGLSEDCVGRLNDHVSKILQDIEGDVMGRMKEELAPNLANWTAAMAEKVIKALLAGNEAEMRRYLGLDGWNGRSDGPYAGTRKLEEWHPVIHGLLHENMHIALRRDIVATHRDLITSERIHDLEDQNKSLIAQYNKLKAGYEDLWARYRDDPAGIPVITDQGSHDA